MHTSREKKKKTRK